MDSICEIEKPPDLDWLMLEPKKAHRKKRLAKQWLNERAYDDILYDVNPLLKKHIKVPELVESKLVNQASNDTAQDDSYKNNSVRMVIR